MNKPRFEIGQALLYESRFGFIVGYDEDYAVYKSYWPYYADNTQTHGVFTHGEEEIRVWVNIYNRQQKKNI